MSQPRNAIIGSQEAGVEPKPLRRGSTVTADTRDGSSAIGLASGLTSMRDRSRGIVLVVVAVIGLAAEAVSTIQDGIGGPKVIAVACFAFLFWWGWEMAQRKPPPKGAKPPTTGTQ